MGRLGARGTGRARRIGLLAVLTVIAGGTGLARAAERVTAEPGAAPECKNAGVKVTFTRGSTELDANGRGALAGVATWLQNGEHRTVRLEGYADKSGGATGNQRLSERRAQSAKDFLLAKGIDPDRIMVFGHGEAPEHPELTGTDARVVLVTVCDVPKELAAEIPAPAQQASSTPEPTPAPAPPPPTLAPPRAIAATPPPVPAPPVVPVPAYTPAPGPPPQLPPAPPGPPSGVGVEATVGGGAIGFIDQSSRNVAGTGASWDARLMFGSRLPIAIETAYLGSVQSIDALGLSTSSLLLGNGVEGTLRVNLTRGRIQPYLFGGAGWTHYQIANSTTTNTSSVLSKDDVGMIPMGAGLAVRIVSNLLVDVRGTYRATFNDDLLRNTSTSDNSMQSWNASARVGFEF